MFKISIQPEEIEKMPLGAFPGEIHVIDKVGLDYARAIAYLMGKKIIGFDLFRINKMGMRRLMCAVLSNPNIMKVGAAVHDDVRGLQYHSKFEAKNFVDLQKIVCEWGIKDKSVKKMSAIILGCRISKTQQLSNWEADELSGAQKMYAATDAWICREMYMKLLGSEKNPLTPEQLAPNPQQNDTDNTQERS